jgi:hypothetical protein
VKNAPTSDRITAGWKAAVPGCTMTRTPAKPTMIASQRRQPTVSPSNGIERAQSISGVVKVIEAVTVSGRNRMAVKLQAVEAMRQRPRAISSHGRLVVSTARPCAGRDSAETSSSWPA